MEKTTQRYTKYFYVILLIAVIWQLLEVIMRAIRMDVTYTTIILLILSIINIIIVGSSLKHNIKQEFIECKATAKIARITVGLFVIVQAFSINKYNLNWITLSNQLTSLCMIEAWLSYRIKSISHLEELARDYSKKKGRNGDGHI